MDALDSAEIRLKYSTWTHLALDEAGQVIEEGGRLGVPKIVVLVTDGAAWNGDRSLRDETVAAAAKLHAADIKVFALGLYPEQEAWYLNLSQDQLQSRYPNNQEKV